MKLRLQSNSIRLRLKRGEVEQLAKTGRVEETIVFGAGANDVLHYILEASPAISLPQASLKSHDILVQLPRAIVSHWATSDEVGIEAIQSLGTKGELVILIEKDFACLKGTEEQNVDTFPHPMAGAKC